MKKLVLSMMSVAILAGAGWGCAHKAETKSVEQPVQTPPDGGPAAAEQPPAPPPVNAPPN